MVLVNDQKGEELLEKVKERFYLVPVSKEQAISFNPFTCTSPSKPDRRNEFWSDYKVMTVKQLARKYAPNEAISLRLKKFAYRMKMIISNK